MEHEFTEGPWFLEYPGGRVLAEKAGFAPTPQEPVFVVANNVYVTAKDKEHMANQQLISAAPDLLAACEEFVRKCECGEAKSKRSYTQMKTAIAKATGKGGE